YISGKGTDSTELSKTLRHRVKGQTENALKQMSFRHQYSFRPGLMKPTEGQKNYTNRLYKPLYMFLHVFYDTCTIKQVGLSMINTALYGYPQNILEISDIIIASQQQGDSQKIEEHSGEIQDDQIANS
ncbi:MAG: putative nucleoside-diphosphate sugar epimerase, partial [Streblomastix strix]